MSTTPLRSQQDPAYAKRKIASAKRYYARNRERVLAQDRQQRVEDGENGRAKARENYAKRAEEIRHNARAYREQNVERMRERDRAYHAAHAETRRAQARASYARHREKRVAERRAYVEKNREELLAKKRKGRRPAMSPEERRSKRLVRDRAYYHAHKPEKKRYNKAYQQANLDKFHEYAARRRAAKAQAPINDLTLAQWQEMKAHFGYRCAYCNKKPKRLEKDHITALSKGGSHTASNIVPACRSCNARKRERGPLVPVQPLFITLAPAKEARVRPLRTIGARC